MCNSIIRQNLCLSFLIHRLTYQEYFLLREFLECESPTPTSREIYTPLISEILSCLPANSISIHFYQIQLLTSLVLPRDLTNREQRNLAEILGVNQDTREILITAFANYHIPRSSRFTPAPESFNSIVSVAPIAPKKILKAQSLSPLDISSEKVSNKSLLESLKKRYYGTSI